mgnify:FL=1
MVFIIYIGNLNNQLFWDDDDWIINNTYVHTISWDNIKFWLTHNTLAGVGLKSNYYRPFLFLTFAINYVSVGVKPLIWHLTSNLLHIANGLLVFSILYLVFRKRLVAFITALIFLIHPLQTEAVTYISGRGDLLVLFFMLLALWLFTKTNLWSCDHQRFGNSSEVEPPLGGSTSKYRNWYLAASVLSVIIALLSRETAIIFPFLFMVFYIAFLSPISSFWAAFKKSFILAIPYFAVVIAYGILRLTVLNFQNTLNFYAVANTYSESLAVRLFTFANVLLGYFKLLLVPTGLHMERGVTVYTSLFQWPVWPVFIGLLSLIGWLVFLYKKQKPNLLTTNFRVWFFGVGWFFVGLVPVSGITPINAVMYEHWLYLPMIGFWFIAAFYLAKFFQGSTLNLQKGRTFILRILIVTALAAYFVFFAYQSIQRNILWGKPIDFYQDILKYEPDSTRVNNNLGNLYFNQGDLANAEKHYEAAAAGDDSFPQPHFNLGSILESRGDIFGAIKKYEQAIEVDPNFYFAYQSLVAVYAKKGDLVKATEYVEILKKLKPQDPRVFYNAALIYLARKDIAAVVSNLKAGLEVTDSDPYAKGLIEELLTKLGQ